MDRSLTTSAVESGLLLIGRGLFKKIVIADSMARLVDASYQAPDGLGTVGALIAIYAFALQIYGDFSGYTDIARGSAKLLGVDLMENFAQPYFSRSITEFWRRWHVSLSDWLRDYLYIPLGGNRNGRLRTNLNLLITMLLGGLWHGAAWTFVLWGGLHGLWLASERLWGSGREYSELPASTDWWRIGLTFHGVALLWVVFRAESLAQVREILAQLLSLSFVTIDFSALAILVLMILLVVRMDRVERSTPPTAQPSVIKQGLLLGSFVSAIAVFAGTTVSPLIYFQF